MNWKLVLPLVQEAVDNLVFPWISAAVDKVQSPTEKAILNDFLPAIKKALDDGIADLGK